MYVCASGRDRMRTHVDVMADVMGQDLTRVCKNAEENVEEFANLSDYRCAGANLSIRCSEDL